MILFNKFAVAMQLRAQDRSRARMRSELRQVPEEVLSRKERKIRQWEAEIKLLRVKRKRMLDAGNSGMDHINTCNQFHEMYCRFHEADCKM